MRLSLERAKRGPGASCAWASSWGAPAFGIVPPGLAADLRCAAARRRQLHARPTRLGQADGDGLFGAASTVLALAYVVHLLANEFPRLSAGCFTFFFVLLGSFHC